MLVPAKAVSIMSGNGVPIPDIWALWAPVRPRHRDERNAARSRRL